MGHLAMSLVDSIPAQEAAFALPMLIMAGVMFLMMALFRKKPENPSVVDMNTPSIQMTRGGTIPIVHGTRRVGATFAWVGNRYTVEEPVESVGKSVARGTLVDSKNGMIAVEKIKKGDRLWVRNKRGRNVLRRVKAVSQRTVDCVIRINRLENPESTSKGGTCKIEITPDHLMWARAKTADAPRWIQARDIHPGDFLYLRGEIESEVTGVVSIEKDVEVFCPSMSRFSPKNFYAAGVCVHNLPDVEITQTAYFESAWHILSCGPVTTIEGIWENGKKIAGPFYSGSTPSGTLVTVGENSSFRIYWGLSDSVGYFDGNCSGGSPASADPILSQFCQVESGATSCWPNVCFVVWQTRRLGVYPRWPQVEYEIKSEASGQAQSYSCGFELDDADYTDEEGLDGVNPALSMFLFLTAPYPCGLGIPGETMDYSLFYECANHIKSAERWNSNVLAQHGHEYHRMIGEAMSDMGAVMVERDGLIGPKIIRNNMPSDSPAPILTGDILRPPDDELSRSHIAPLNETIQFKFHQRTLNYRQQTIDIDNQTAVADGEFRRKKTTAELATITGWRSASIVSNRRTYESTVSGSSIVLNGDRELRELSTGAMVDVAGVGKYRITASTPDFDSAGVRLELTLDPYSVGEITSWNPDDGSVLPGDIVVEQNISNDIFIARSDDQNTGESQVHAVALVVRAHQSMNDIGWYYSSFEDGGSEGVRVNVNGVRAIPGGNCIHSRGTWINDENRDAEITMPCVIAFYPNGDHYSVPTSPATHDYALLAKVWKDPDSANSAVSCCTAGTQQPSCDMELVGVPYFIEMTDDNYLDAAEATQNYNEMVNEGYLPEGMKLFIPVSVKRGAAADFGSWMETGFQGTWKQGTLMQATTQIGGPGGPPFLGSMCYQSNRLTMAYNSVTSDFLAEKLGLVDSAQIKEQMLNSQLSGVYYATKFVPCISDGSCVPYSDCAWINGKQCGGLPWYPRAEGCEIECADTDEYNATRFDITRGGGEFTESDWQGNRLSGAGSRNFYSGGASGSLIQQVRSGGLPGDYGDRTGVTIPANGGLVETVAASTTDDLPDQGYMGMLDGYYRIHQADHTSTSSSKPTPQMLAFSWTYKIPGRVSRNILGSQIGTLEELSKGYFKVTLQGAGIKTGDTARLPGIWETPDRLTSIWSTWVDFEEWTLGKETNDRRFSMASVVTFALPRAKEKALLAKYLNTSEPRAVSAMLGLGGRNRLADDLSITEPRCRFVLSYIFNGKEISATPVYVRAIGTDGETTRTPENWWD